jgi:Pilus biogenesis CpaD protein (pilus_cpaD)
MTRPFAFVVLFGLAALGACDVQMHTPTPNYTIGVTPAPNGPGYVANPPTCPSWTDQTASFFDNQPNPQFGCADARNLAIMVEQPGDLLQGRNMGPASGVTADGSIIRYNNNQTRGLIYTSGSVTDTVDTTTSSSASSSMSGEAAPAAPASK